MSSGTTTEKINTHIKRKFQMLILCPKLVHFRQFGHNENLP